MHIVIKFLLVVVGIGLLFMGLVFMMAYEGGMENVAIGAVMLVMAMVIFVFMYRIGKAEAKKTTVVKQTFNVKMGGSGELKQRQMKCKNCGAPIEDKDLKMIDGGIMYTCSYCNSVGAFEEEPKW